MRKGIIFLCICVCLCCTVLAGCIGEDVAVKINSDGSGNAVITYGFSQQGVELMNEQGVDKTFIAGLKEIELEGNKYYGKSDSYTFKNIEEFNNIFNTNFMSEYGFANLSLKEIENDYLCLTLKIDKKYQNFDEIFKSIYPNLSETDIMYLKYWLSFKLNFVLPGNVYSLNNDLSKNVNVVMKGCTLSIDFRRLYDTQREDSCEYEFIITTNPNIYFLDVSENYWGRNAIYSLGYGGLVKGVGNNLFNPNDTITRSEFYTILARAVGMNTYEKDGYWAYGGIYSCGYYDLIVDWTDEEQSGVLNREDWDIPISREEAVSSVYLAYLWSQPKSNLRRLSLADIPDYKSIAEKYANNVLGAYNYKIIDGVDDKYTFNPKGLLKRVEVCQIFYNINWCSPIS